MSNTATELQGSLCNFCGSKPVIDGGLAQTKKGLEAEIELAVGLISKSATY